MKILTNALGIADSGGITVFNKYLEEINNSPYSTIVCYNQGPLIDNVVAHYQNNPKISFIIFQKSGIIKRLWLENTRFNKIVKENDLRLIYNLSGSAQLLPILQLTKLQNLMFYSSKLDDQYKKQGKLIQWFKQIFIKRFVFLNLYKFQKNFEIQSSHVENMFLQFCHNDKFNFFIKSDIDVDSKSFLPPKYFDFSNKVFFLYIIGPHFEMVHKNFKDFVAAMILLAAKDKNFEIVITLTEAQLTHSKLWDERLNPYTNFIGYLPQTELQAHFKDNTIVISNSVIETLGLHIIEAIKRGCLTIAPNEEYAKSVYGNELIFYEINNPQSLVEKITSIKRMSQDELALLILKAQKNLEKSEHSKIRYITMIFDLLLK